MKEFNHTPNRSVELFIGILATGILVVGLFLYAMKEPARIRAVQAEQLQIDLDEAMSVYAGNCAECHGLSGEGIGPSLPLNNPALRQAEAKSLRKIISRGLHNTRMAPWGKEDGGPLSEYQIEQLVNLIQFGDWQAAGERAESLGLASLLPLVAEPDPQILANLNALPDGDTLVLGVMVYARQCVSCHAPDGQGTPQGTALNDPEVRAKPSEEIHNALLQGVPETNMAGWADILLPEEVSALEYLIANWELVPLETIPEANVRVPVTEKTIVRGKELYRDYCALCHGESGAGTPRSEVVLNSEEYLANTNDTALGQIIMLGVPDTSMPAWSEYMPLADIQSIVGYLRTLEPDMVINYQ